jgi:UDP-GlcNAc:undecaprenyl-phosphate GlcNAc-1-phosphate transferase
MTKLSFIETFIPLRYTVLLKNRAFCRQNAVVQYLVLKGTTLKMHKISEERRMIRLMGYFTITFFVALITTPIVRKLALRWHIFARPNHRTVHNGAIPKLGGGAIFLAFLLGVAAAYFFEMNLILEHSSQVLSLIVGTTILFIMGTFDDKMDLDCNLKLAFEMAVAALAAFSGWRVETLVLPAAQEIHLGFLSYPVTILWIVGIANAINMVDGLDGLASGIAIVISIVSLAIAGLFHNHLVILLSVLLAGAVAGFLRYNVNPASIFMGDSGSLSLGFILGCVTLSASTVATGKIAVLVPVLLLGIPITDTSLAIIRRVRRGIHPFHADREHIHHRLVRLGLSQSGAALFMVGMSLILGIMAFLFAQGTLTDARLFSHFLPLP